MYIPTWAENSVDPIVGLDVSEKKILVPAGCSVKPIIFICCYIVRGSIYRQFGRKRERKKWEGLLLFQQTISVDDTRRFVVAAQFRLRIAADSCVPKGNCCQLGISRTAVLSVRCPLSVWNDSLSNEQFEPAGQALPLSGGKSPTSALFWCTTAVALSGSFAGKTASTYTHTVTVLFGLLHCCSKRYW